MSWGRVDGWLSGSYHNCLVSFTFFSGFLRSKAVLFDVEHLASHRERCSQPCQEQHGCFCSAQLYNGAKSWTAMSSRLVHGVLAPKDSPFISAEV